MADRPLIIRNPRFLRIARGRVIYRGDPNGTPESRIKHKCSPIHFAAKNKYDEVYGIEYLLDAGADINSRDICGRTALNTAVLHRKGKIVNTLLKRGADPNLGDKDGTTPLFYAAFYYPLKDVPNEVQNQLHITISLLKWKADINVHNAEGLTPLMYAAWGYSLDIVNLLLWAGADVLARDKDSRTCLHFSLFFPGKIQMMKKLVIAGVSPLTHDNDDRLDIINYIIYSDEHSKLQKVREVKELIKISTLVYYEKKLNYCIDLCFRYRIGRFGDECCDEVQTMRFITLSRRWNLCDFAIRGRGRNPERIVDRAFEKSMELHLVIYNDHLASHFGRDYLLNKFLDKKSVIYARSAQMNVVFPYHLKKGLCNSLTETDMYNLLNVILQSPLVLLLADKVARSRNV